MSKAIFTSKIDPTYDDLPEDRYHFPSSYLNRVQQSVGDWIVYYEPRRKAMIPIAWADDKHISEWRVL